MSELQRQVEDPSRVASRSSPGISATTSAGKRTLTPAPAYGASAQVQRQADGNQHPIDPGAIQVDQYAEGTDPTRFNDCGAACIVMALRAIGVEPQLIAKLDKTDRTKSVLEKELEYVRKINPAADNNKPMTVEQVRQCLVAVLQRLGVPTKVDLHAAFQVIGDAGYLDTTSNKQGTTGHPEQKGRAEAFLQATCVDGSAAIIMGLPNAGAWGWGGTADPGRRKDPNKTDGSLQDIPDQGGSHFVFVWRPDPTADAYVVMDPSWSAPRPPVKLEILLEFIYARDTSASQSMPINIMAIPYAEVAKQVPAAPPATKPATTPTAAAPATPSASVLRKATPTAATATAPAPAARPPAARWSTLLGRLGVATAPPRGRTMADLFGGPASADRAVQTVQRKAADAPPAADGEACLAPDATLADLRRIADEAHQIRAAVDPDGAGANLAAGAGAQYTASLRALTHQTEVLRPVIDGCGDLATRGQLDAQFTLSQDAVLVAYQTLAVHYADQTLQAWSNADPKARGDQRGQYHKESGGLAATEDWCGMFVDAQYRQAGMSGALNMVFNSTFHVREFFTYGSGSNNSPTKIIPHGKGDPVAVHDYHTTRGALRSWLERAAIGDDIRPGDVVTLDWLGGADDDPKNTKSNDQLAALDQRADHICIVRSYTPASGDKPGILITIDGNAYGAQKPGAAAPKFDGTDPQAANATATGSDVSTNQYQTGAGGYSTAAPQNDGPAFNREASVPKPVDVYKAMTLMGRGRPSLVDFEPDHVYPNFTGRTDDRDGPGGPVQAKP